MSDLNLKEIVLTHIIENEFMPAVKVKLERLVDEMTAQRLFVIEYKEHIGKDLGLKKIYADLSPEIDLLKKHVLLVFDKKNEN